MRRLIYIIPMLMMLLCMVSCERRPFAAYSSKVILDLKIDTDILHHDVSELPSDMVVQLYNPETGKLVYTDYVGPEGGIIHPLPGVYDMIVYNFGTESTILQNESHYEQIEAYTNEVSSFLRSQLQQFLAKRAKAAQERAEKKLAETGGVVTKDPVKAEDEIVVNQPDHLFVGWYHNLNVPSVLEDEEIQEITIEVQAASVVETWLVEIKNVVDAHLITETSALMSGQKGSVHIGPNKASDKLVNIYFDFNVEDNGNGGKCLKGKLNTFGMHIDKADAIYLDLSVGNKGGGAQYFNFDVTDKCRNNAQRHIIIEEPITIVESEGGGGGFKPEVDDWEDINTDINL